MPFDYDSLWNKSKVYIDRALAARDNSDDELFHLWAALSLELLAKATLARISPALVADPSHFESLFAACGGKTYPTLKSITAKTVFERLTHVSQEFDERTKRTCMKMVDRRNAELHSGDLSCANLDQRAWVPSFWKAISVLLNAQNRPLADWLGDDEAERISEVLADAAELLQTTVRARIERRGREFDRRYRPGSAERKEVAHRAAAMALPSRFYAIGDAQEEGKCPACGCKGWLVGYEWTSGIVDSGFEEDEAYGRAWEVVETVFETEEFHCAECGLDLEGRDEIAVAELPREFQRREEREPDYGADYGND